MNYNSGQFIKTVRFSYKMIFIIFSFLLSTPSYAEAEQKKTNVLIIFGDDIGVANISAYSKGLMGYKTPNIDSIAKSGMMFTDYYGEQSCTAGRAAIITGQSPLRTGLLKVGLPGSKAGMQAGDPTIAELLKPLGYATGQFGKNHLGDLNEHLPTNHGFDEFYGNLYHLNAEEEPENPDYPKNPEFRKKYGPRGVIHSYANGKIVDTGPLNKERMKTIDEESLAKTKAFIKKAQQENKPFFVWFNATRMHFYTHVKDDSLGKTGQGFYADAMVEHDGHVGQLLKLLDELGITDNTMVVYTTDNGPHFNEWPDGGITWFRGEKNTNWEGAYRVPAMVKLPGKIKPGTVSNQIMSHLDWLPTIVALAGDNTVKEKLLDGYTVGKKTFKVHLDGYNFLPYLTGENDKSPRKDFFYFSDDGLFVGLRYNDWKLVFAEQNAHYFDVWAYPFIQLRVPKVFNLRRDPFERADTDSNNYRRWWVQHAFILIPAKEYVMKFFMTFKKYPMRQKPDSLNMEKVLNIMTRSISGT